MHRCIRRGVALIYRRGSLLNKFGLFKHYYYIPALPAERD